MTHDGGGHTADTSTTSHTDSATISIHHHEFSHHDHHSHHGHSHHYEHDHGRHHSHESSPPSYNYIQINQPPPSYGTITFRSQPRRNARRQNESRELDNFIKIFVSIAVLGFFVYAMMTISKPSNAGIPRNDWGGGWTIRGMGRRV